ncbi:MAG: hypothetical protein WC136_01320 [Sphaerochaeta sp.]|jgi:RNA polymerase-binding transcription factor DksA
MNTSNIQVPSYQILESLRKVVKYYLLNPDYDMFMSRLKFLRDTALKFKHESLLDTIDHEITLLENGDYGICDAPELHSNGLL